MTSNQIEYWKLRETERHNRATERQSASDLQEQQRSNLANEQLANERNFQSAVGNTINMQLGQQRLAEERRANLAKEAATVKSQDIERQRVLISSQALENQRQIAQINASAQRYGATLNYAAQSHSLAENVRHNLVSENLGQQAEDSKRITADTSQQGLLFSKEQYNDTGRNLVQSQIKRNESQVSVDMSTINRNNVRNSLDTVDTSANVINSLSGLIGNATRLIPLVGGLK